MNARAIPQMQRFLWYKCFNYVQLYSHIMQMDAAVIAQIISPLHLGMEARCTRESVSCVAVDVDSMMGLYQSGKDVLIRVKCFLSYYAAYT